MTTSLIPVCSYQAGDLTQQPIEQRNAMVNVYGDEVLQNGGQLTIQDNGDIYITRQTEELYGGSLYQGTFIEKDQYFINMSKAERWIMSDFEYNSYVSRTIHGILKRYMTEEEANLIYTDPDKYYEKLAEIYDKTATVVMSVEAVVWEWLERAFGDAIELIKSDMLENVFKRIKIRQLSISAYTELRSWMYGVARTQFPFVYLKDTGIYDMCNLGTTPRKLTEIDMSPYDPNNMDVYWKEITSNKKSLMTVCKQTDTEYWALPEGIFKNQIYQDPMHSAYIGNLDDIFEAIQTETIWHGDYIEYNVNISNESVTKHLEKMYNKYVLERYGQLLPLGLTAWRDTKTQSYFMNDYGITVPISRTMCQKQKVLKFNQGDKFVIYFSFLKQDEFAGDEARYFDPYSPYAPKAQHRYVGQAKIWTNKAAVTNVDKWPLLSRDDFKDDIDIHTKEFQSRQDFQYDETQIDDGFTRGDYFYMTDSQQSSSSGFIGITLRVGTCIPSLAYKTSPTSPIYYTTTPKTVVIRQILSVQDINDVYQIKDTIATMKCEMLSKLYGYLDMYVRNHLEMTADIKNTVPQSQVDKVFYGGLRQCLKEVSWGDRQRFFDQVFPKKQLRIHDVFVYEFEDVDTRVDYFTHIQDVIKSEYAYELKTFADAKSNNQAYTSNTKIQYAPINLPFDMTAFKADPVYINVNAMVPTITADMEMGGGLLAKKTYKIIEDVYIKYIVSRSKDFVSGLSNSEIVRFELSTFNTDNLDKLYEDVLPSSRKEISILLRRLTKNFESEEQQKIYRNSPILTNMMLDHNYLTQADMIRMSLTIWSRD